MLVGTGHAGMRQVGHNGLRSVRQLGLDLVQGAADDSSSALAALTWGHDGIGLMLAPPGPEPADCLDRLLRAGFEFFGCALTQVLPRLPGR